SRQDRGDAESRGRDRRLAENSGGGKKAQTRQRAQSGLRLHLRACRLNLVRRRNLSAVLLRQVPKARRRAYSFQTELRQVVHEITPPRSSLSGATTKSA